MQNDTSNNVTKELEKTSDIIPPKKKSLLVRGLRFVAKRIAIVAATVSAGFLARTALQHMVDNKTSEEQSNKNFKKETKKKSSRVKN